MPDTIPKANSFPFQHGAFSEVIHYTMHSTTFKHPKYFVFRLWYLSIVILSAKCWLSLRVVPPLDRRISQLSVLECTILLLFNLREQNKNKQICYNQWLKSLAHKISSFVVKMEVLCTFQSATSNRVFTVFSKYSINFCEIELNKSELN